MLPGSLSVPHTNDETEILSALDHFNAGTCAALDAVDCLRVFLK